MKSKPSICVCSVITKSHLAQVRVMVESVRENHPDAVFYVLIVDNVEEHEFMSEKSFNIVILSDLGITPGELKELLKWYSPFEICCILKPWIIKFVLLKKKRKDVFYCDADLMFFGALLAEHRLLQKRAVLLTPHLRDAASKPSANVVRKEAYLLATGDYNAGFIGVRRCAESLRFLEWWAERSLTNCKKRPAQGFYDDQKWLNYVPIFFKGVEILRNPGLNVAYWNAHERDLRRRGRRYSALGMPLVFMHFSGVSPDGKGEWGKTPAVQENRYFLELEKLYMKRLLGGGPSINLNLRQYALQTYGKRNSIFQAPGKASDENKKVQEVSQKGSKKIEKR